MQLRRAMAVLFAAIYFAAILTLSVLPQAPAAPHDNGSQPTASLTMPAASLLSDGLKFFRGDRLLRRPLGKLFGVLAAPLAVVAIIFFLGALLKVLRVAPILLLFRPLGSQAPPMG